MPGMPGGHTHGRHGYRLTSADSLRAHLFVDHHVDPSVNATWDQLTDDHRAEHERQGEARPDEPEPEPALREA